MEKLDDHDDVQGVASNFNIPQEALADSKSERFSVGGVGAKRPSTPRLSPGHSAKMHHTAHRASHQPIFLPWLQEPCRVADRPLADTQAANSRDLSRDFRLDAEAAFTQCRCHAANQVATKHLVARLHVRIA